MVITITTNLGYNSFPQCGHELGIIAHSLQYNFLGRKKKINAIVSVFIKRNDCKASCSVLVDGTTNNTFNLNINKYIFSAAASRTMASDGRNVFVAGHKSLLGLRQCIYHFPLIVGTENTDHRKEQIMTSVFEPPWIRRR